MLKFSKSDAQSLNNFVFKICLYFPMLFIIIVVNYNAYFVGTLDTDGISGPSTEFTSMCFQISMG